jgi:hypothetical protein
MTNEAAPEPARSVIRPCRPSVHASKGGGGSRGTDGETDTCALGTGHTLVYIGDPKRKHPLFTYKLLFWGAFQVSKILYEWAIK